MAKWQVFVGNVGTVYDGENLTVALRIYQDSRWRSKENIGRMAGEPVTVMRDGEPWAEYEGTLREE